MSVVFVLALTIPGVGVLATVAVPARRAGTMLASIDALAAMTWVAVVLGGGASAGRFHAPPVVAAACAGAGLAGAAVFHRRHLEQVLPVGLAVGALAAGLTLGLVEGRGGVLFVTMLLVALLVSSAERGRDLVVFAAAAAVGLAWLGVGLLVAHGKVESWTLPGALAPTTVSGRASVPTFGIAALLIGCAALAVAGSIRGRPVDALLLIGAMAIALRVAGVLAGPSATASMSHNGAVPALAVGLGASAVAAALMAPPGLAVGLLAIAAIAGPTGDVGAAVLLGAAAVLCVLSTRAFAVAAAVPGAVALAAALRGEPGPVAALLGLALAGVVAVIGWRLRASRSLLIPSTRAAPTAVAALALSVWLLVAPGAWAWTSPGLLAGYQRGALLGVAGGLIVMFTGAGWAWLGVRGRPRPTPSAG